MARSGYPSQYCPTSYPHLRHTVYGAPRTYRCPGIRIPDESRLNPVSVRRAVLRALRDSSAGVHGLIGRWDVTGTMYDETGRDVPRPVDSYPENSVASWQALDKRLGQIIADLTALQRLAMRRAEHGLAVDAQLRRLRHERNLRDLAQKGIDS